MSGKNPVPPISSHPAFTKAVAAWFSALFGLSVLVLPHFALESVLSTIGLSSMLTFFAAPLSPAAHMALCGLGAIFGAFVGIVIAKRLRGSDASVEISADIPDSEPSVAAADEAPSPAAKPADVDQPEPASVAAQAEPAEEAPAPRSIADRLASRVRASENVEPSISEDVAALAADKMAREADAAVATQDEAVEELSEADDGAQNDTANSADFLLAKMPAVNQSDAWKSDDYAPEQKAEQQEAQRWDDAGEEAAELADTPEEQLTYASAETAMAEPESAEAEQEELDVLSSADPLYDDPAAPMDVSAGADEDSQVEGVESFLAESLSEEEVSASAPSEPALVEPAPSEIARAEIAGAAAAGAPVPEETSATEAKIAEVTRKPDLSQMLSRLEKAIGNFEAEEEDPQAPGADLPTDETQDDDPVVTYLRQEATSNGATEIDPQSASEPQAEEDPEQVLRKALDRLTQLSG